MVCKECGAYNAEHLTHCRVCAAKLRESDTAVQETGVAEPEAPARPTRSFAQAPQWPARPYAGAPEPKPIPETPAPESAAPVARPAAPAAKSAAPAAKSAAPAAQEEKRFCTACGKPLFADAPFCAYCGAKNVLAAQPAAPAAARPVPAASAQAEEESRPLKRAPQPKPPALPDDDDELEDDDDGDFSDLYDDDDDEYYDDEFDDDDDYPKRKGKGGTILFIALVLVLLALIAFFGIYIVKKNYGGSVSNMISSLTGGAPVSEADDNNGPNVVSSDVTADNMKATIEETMDGDVEVVKITVSAPNGSAVRIISAAQLEKDTTTIEQGDSITLQVPRAVFLPGTFCDSTTVSVTPQLEITLPDGSKKMLDVPAFNVTVPQVTMVLTEPVGESVEATADGSPIKVVGTVTDHTVTVTVNGAAVQVLEGGVFSYDYTPTAEEGQTIQILAQKENYMTAAQTISVTPYVVKEMPITITSSVKDKKLTAADGKVTVEGTTAPGATVTAICENKDIVCSAVSVTETGAFTCVIEVPKEGCYEINFAATAEGYDDNAASCIVERVPTTKSSTYREKALNLNKNYTKVAEGKSTETALAVTGKVKEILQDPNYVIFTIETSKDELVYVCNRSDKNKIESNDIGETKTVAGFNAGLYPETTCPYIWGWFIWNK